MFFNRSDALPKGADYCIPAFDKLSGKRNGFPLLFRKILFYIFFVGTSNFRRPKKNQFGEQLARAE